MPAAPSVRPPWTVRPPPPVRRGRPRRPRGVSRYRWNRSTGRTRVKRSSPIGPISRTGRTQPNATDWPEVSNPPFAEGISRSGVPRRIVPSTANASIESSLDTDIWDCRRPLRGTHRRCDRTRPRDGPRRDRSIPERGAFVEMLRSELGDDGGSNAGFEEGRPAKTHPRRSVSLVYAVPVS